MKADVVYTYRASGAKGSDDWELKHSLRTLEGQEWLGEVYIVGDLPAWASDEVRHIECGDPHKPKDANIIHKILTACNTPGISDHIVCNSDDHYIMRPVSYDELGPWRENPSRYPEAVRRKRENLWFRRMVETIEWCRANGYPDWVLQGHTPYPVEREKFIRAMECCPWDKRNGLLVHVYYNIAYPTEPPPERLDMTLRVNKALRPNQFKADADSCTFLNHNDRGLTVWLRGYIDSRFPDKSRWER